MNVRMSSSSHRLHSKYLGLTIPTSCMLKGDSEKTEKCMYWLSGVG